MYSFVWRPRWILSHLLVLGLIVSMVWLSMWQIRRMHEKQDLNALIVSRADTAPRELAEVLTSEDVTSTADGERVEYQATTVTGTYVTDEEFTIPNRTLDGAPGRWVVTPLEWSEDQPRLLVLRGFIPQVIDDDAPPIDSVEPPEGNVTVLGWLRAAEVPEGIQSTKADLGDNRFARVDIDRIEQVVGAEFVPAFLQLGTQDPATESPLLTPFPLPERSEGPHFSYAVQWAIFTLIALIGYPLVLRKVARSRAEDSDDVVASDNEPAEP